MINLQIYEHESLVQMRRELLLRTNMIDSVIETYPELQVPKQLEERRDQILEQRDRLKAQVDPVVQILERDAVKEMMEMTRDRDGNQKILDYVIKNHDVSYYIVE